MEPDAPRRSLSCSEDIVFMLNANLFRALPPSKGGDQENYDPDEEEPSLEPTWPHLQVGPGFDLGFGVRVESGRSEVSARGAAQAGAHLTASAWSVCCAVLCCAALCCAGPICSVRCLRSVI